MTNVERIIRVLRERDGLDDDEISAATDIRPRQTVNQICRRLESQGLLRRTRSGAGGKIINFLKSETAHRCIGQAPRPVGDRPRECGMAGTSQPAEAGFVVPDPRRTLIIIPCSASKVFGSSAAEGSSILDQIPDSLAAQLRAARRAIFVSAQLDESTLMPAWRRYNGELYGAAGAVLRKMVTEAWHVVIVSGCYGLLLAEEPIGWYKARFDCSHWPRGLLESVLEAFVKRHELTTVRAFASKTTDYGKLLQRVRWAGAGVTDGWIFSPNAPAGAWRTSPRAQGQALVSLAQGTLTDCWESSDGLSVQPIRLT